MAELNSAQPRIRRCHSGCKSCRRRGKKCDETKPSCKACLRLKLQCIYGTDFVFYHVSSSSYSRGSGSKVLAETACQDHPRRAVREADNVQAQIANTGIRSHQRTQPSINTFLRTAFETDSAYLNHFNMWIRRDLLNWPDDLIDDMLSSTIVRCAVMCLSASHLAVLDSNPVQSKMKSESSWSTRSVAFNRYHYKQSQLYLIAAIEQLQLLNDSSNSVFDIVSALTARTLLAYYYHAAANHLQFKSSVLESFDFVGCHYKTFSTCPRAKPALQFWYRLNISSRFSKRPALPLEGECQDQMSPISFSPNIEDHILSLCCLGMSSDDLVYHIMIKMIELRSRIIINSYAAHVSAVSETSRDINKIAHHVLQQALGEHEDRNHQRDEIDIEAHSSYVSGSHLFELMRIQEQRLQVWRSTLSAEQVPLVSQMQAYSNTTGVKYTKQLRFTSHRNAMNYLYYLLCKIMIAETTNMKTKPWAESRNWHSQSTTTVTELIQDVFSIIDHLDYSQSNLRDIYRFSLAEVLRQFIYSCRSREIFDHVLDTTWPKIDKHGKGFEHSHLPTHLARQLISLVAVEYSSNRNVLLTFSAMPDSTPKSVLMDASAKIAVVICGINETGSFFLERHQLV